MQGMSGNANLLHARHVREDGGTKPAVDNRFITGLSPERKALFLPGFRTVEQCLFVPVNPYAGHVREKVYRDKMGVGTLVSSQDEERSRSR